MAITLPPNSTGTQLAVVTSGGVDYVGQFLADPVTPTQRAAVDAQGGVMVRGEAAAGAAKAGNPVLMGGQDGTNAQTLLTDTAGRQIMAGAAPSGAAKAGNPVLMAGQDGTNAVTLNTNSAATAAANSGNGSMVTSGQGTWAVNHVPATATQATISKAAVAATRHVCTAISWSLCVDGTNAQAVIRKIYLRDGATGAGTILMAWAVNIAVATGNPVTFSISDLNIVGSVNTAMTLEFDAAGVTGSQQTVNLVGYDLV